VGKRWKWKEKKDVEGGADQRGKNRLEKVGREALIQVPAALVGVF
jgi:hypothetical protein